MSGMDLPGPATDLPLETPSRSGGILAVVILAVLFIGVAVALAVCRKTWLRLW